MRIEELDFKNTYGATPWQFEMRVQQALRRTKEEKVMKQFTIRSVTLAIMSVFCLMAVCFATVIPGANDDVLVPQQSPNVAATNPVTTENDALEMAQPTPIPMVEPTPLPYFNKGQTQEVYSQRDVLYGESRIAEFYWQQGYSLEDAVRLRRGEGVVATFMSEYVDPDISFCLEEVSLLKGDQSAAQDMIGAETNLTMLFSMKPGNENVYLVPHVNNINDVESSTQKIYAQLMAEGKTVLGPWAMLSGVRVGGEHWEIGGYNQYLYMVKQEDGSLVCLCQITQADHPIEEIWAAAEKEGGMSLEIELAMQNANSQTYESTQIFVYLEF